jgi:hypothetical protein
MSENLVEIGFKATTGQAGSEVNNFTSDLIKSLSQLNGNVTNLNNNFGGTMGKLTAVGGAFTGLKSITQTIEKTFRSLIGATLDMADAVSKESAQLALTTEELSAYQYGASLSDITNEQLSTSFKKLSMNVVDAANGVGVGSQAFNTLGISVKNTDGTLKSNAELMGEVADKFKAMPDSANKTTIAVDLFGKSGAKMISLLNGGKEGITEFTDEAGRLGRIISSETASGAEKFNDNITKLYAGLGGLSVSLTNGLLPSLIKVTNAINSPAFQTKFQEFAKIVGVVADVVGTVLSTAFEVLFSVLDVVIDVIQDVWDVFASAATSISESIESAFGVESVSKMEFFANVVKVIRLGFLALGFFIETTLTGIAGAIEILAQILVTFAKTASKALELDFDGAKQTWSDGMDELGSIVERKAEELAKIKDKYALKADDVIFGTGGSASSGSSKSPERKDEEGVVPIASGPEQSRVGKWSAELEATKQAYQLQNNLRQMDVQDELNYWQQRLSMAKSGSAEYTDIQRKMIDIKLKQAQLIAQQSLELQQVEIDNQRESSLAAIDISEERAKALLDSGKINQSQFIQMQIDFENKRYEVERAAVEQRIQLALADPTSSPAEKARLNGELQALQAEHTKTMIKINSELAAESNKIWSELSSSMSSLWDKGLEAMMNGTLTWSNAYKAVLAEVGKVFLNFAAQKAKSWLQTEVLQTVYTKVQVLARTALEKMGLMQSTAATASSATAKVGANAAVAGSGAASAMASIPYVGPILAIAAMATMLASVGALSGGIKSARGGFDIPAGLNPMTQLHEQEMVLPKEQAEAVRNMASGGGSSGININIQAMDGQSVRRVLLDNDRAIGDAVRQHIRNGGGRLS